MATKQAKKPVKRGGNLENCTYVNYPSYKFLQKLEDKGSLPKKDADEIAKVDKDGTETTILDELTGLGYIKVTGNTIKPSGAVFLTGDKKNVAHIPPRTIDEDLAEVEIAAAALEEIVERVKAKAKQLAKASKSAPVSDELSSILAEAFAKAKAAGATDADLKAMGLRQKSPETLMDRALRQLMQEEFGTGSLTTALKKITVELQAN